MDWINFRVLWPKLKIVKPYLPQSVFSQIERVFRKPNPTRAQLSRIAVLGESVGLERNEIIAAIDAPLSNQGVPVEGRASIFIPMILVSILIVVISLLTWAVVDPDTFPFHLYTPGTLYGSIRPLDFSS